MTPREPDTIPAPPPPSSGPRRAMTVPAIPRLVQTPPNLERPRFAPEEPKRRRSAVRA